MQQCRHDDDCTGDFVGVPAQLRRTNRGAAQPALWVRVAGELLPVSALVAERNSSPRGSAATGLLGRCYEGIPDFARAHGMVSFSDQHHDPNVTRGVLRFRDTVRALVGAAQGAAGVRGRVLPPPGQASGAARTRRGRAEMDFVVRQPVASDARGAEPPVLRHLYNPEEDVASRARRQQLREGQAVAGRSGGHVGVQSGVSRLVRRSVVYSTPSRRSLPTYRGRLHIFVGQGHQDVHGGAGRAQGGHRGRHDPGGRPHRVAQQGI
jgi:hypothetical protein